MRYLFYGLAFLVSFATGWVVQLGLNSPAAPLETDLVIKSAPQKNSVNQPTENHERVASQKPHEPALDQDVESVDSLDSSGVIEALYTMDKASFGDLLNSWWESDNPPSSDLIEGLLNDLFTISDPETRKRVIQLLGAGRFYQFDNPESELLNVEEWIVAKVRNNEQQTEWLKVLSIWGVHGEGHAEFLADSLNSYYELDARVSTLLALSQGVIIPGFQDANTTEKITSIIRPYLDSENELERAAAVRAQAKYAGEDGPTVLVEALVDSSERVRISAAQALMDGLRLNSNEIRDALVNNMQSLESSAEERVTSYNALRFMPLEGKHYEAVYDFRLNHAYRLEQEYRRDRGDQITP